MNKVVCIIPARMASIRFPGKPIANILGHPMIEHVFQRVKRARYIDEIYIATCDKEVKKTAEKFGASVIMTSNKHTRGTDRVAEAASKTDADIVINVQGDEPLVDPASLDKAIEMMKQNKDIKCINLVSFIHSWDVFIDYNVVKAVIDQNNRVLYFSRQPIPTSTRENFKEGAKQIGIYFFRKEFLSKFSSWEETPLEKKEGIDMMRILEKGYPIDICMSKDMVSVDTSEELKKMEALLKDDPLYIKIFKVG